MASFDRNIQDIKIPEEQGTKVTTNVVELPILTVGKYLQPISDIMTGEARETNYWTDENRLVVNPGKTKIASFSKKYKTAELRLPRLKRQTRPFEERTKK